MRPAYSVILFTTLSGAGYGLLAALGATIAVGAPVGHALPALALGLTLASAGLIASTFHLGRPERAWRAFSQWRTSWLSREGVAAIAVYVVAVPLAALLLRYPVGDTVIRALAVTLVAATLLTVVCTAMIYASLKPVRQWRHPAVVPAYLLLAIATGTLLLNIVAEAAGESSPSLVWLTLLALGGAWLAKEGYWLAAAAPAGWPTVAAAIGLPASRNASLLEPPHTESNYLLREFGYRVARKHARRLRAITRLLAFGLPMLLCLGSLAPSWPSGARTACAVLAATAALAGTLTERWLFFAEARHTVLLYYGAREA